MASITNSLKNALRKFIGQNPALSFISQMYGITYDYSPYDRTQLADTYAHNASVRMLIDKITEGVAALPFKVENKDNEPLPEDWRNEFMTKPNDFQGANDFIENAIREFLIFGECFAIGEQRIGLNTNLKKAVWLNSQYVEFERANGLGITQYISGIDSSKKLDPKDVIHIRGVVVDPETSLHAISLLTTATREIEAINEGRNTEISGFKNQGPRKIVASKTDKAFTKEQGENLKERLGGGGAEKAGRTEFTGGSIEVHNMTETAVDLNVQESISNNEKALAKLFKVPLPLISEESSSYNNVQSANRDFTIKTLIPLAEKIYQAINLYTNSEADNAYIKVDIDNIPALKEDVTIKMAAMDKAYASYNQRQKAIGLQGTEEAWGDLPIFPYTVAPTDPSSPAAFNETDLNAE